MIYTVYTLYTHLSIAAHKKMTAYMMQPLSVLFGGSLRQFPMFCVFFCRIINQCAILFKSGAMAGTVPGVLLRIPFQCTSHVWTAPDGRCQQIFCCLCHIVKKLWMHHAPLR